VRRKRTGRPSAETLLHLEIVRTRGAGAVLHTHSVWSTMLSDRHRPDEGLAIEGCEMLKGLEGVRSHEHREWVPIVANDQDMPRLAARVREVLRAEPSAHAFLISGHGLYTWGRTIDEAERHVEILEFLFELAGRR
jgi:methylthioribulose-1-phosphate dehydratase